MIPDQLPQDPSAGSSWAAFFHCLGCCLEGVWNLGLGRQFNIAYNSVQLEAAAESRICVVTSQHRRPADIHYTQHIKFCFFAQNCLYTSVMLYGVKSSTAELLSETKWVPYIHFSYCLQEQVICRKNCLELGFEQKFFEKTNQILMRWAYLIELNENM